jgi:hypothetical protein
MVCYVPNLDELLLYCTACVGSAEAGFPLCAFLKRVGN